MFIATPNEMSYIKIIVANEVRIYRYKKLRRKLYNCNANMFFNIRGFQFTLFYGLMMALL
jgi:hypothetical protein